MPKPKGTVNLRTVKCVRLTSNRPSILVTHRQIARREEREDGNDNGVRAALILTQHKGVTLVEWKRVMVEPE